MNLKTGILILTLTAGTALAQTTGAAQNAHNSLNTVQQKQAQQKPAAKPAAGSSLAPVASKPTASSTAAAVKPSAPKTAHASDPFQKSPAVAAKSTAATASAAAKQSGKPGKAAEKQVAAKAAKPAPAVKATATKSSKNVADKKDDKAENSDQPSDKKYAMTGKRDPFLSPVVNSVGGSGCSTGKKCLEIGQIALKGVVHGESGFIAVVTNTLNKAYFLRENDPVFNGYVVKITGDSIIFRETYQDRLGKSFTREVVKKITTPAV